jgi:hypothetical protein
LDIRTDQASEEFHGDVEGSSLALSSFDACSDVVLYQGASLDEVKIRLMV